MYHGRVVPGFPSHPHRGFETVTIVRQGLIDHSDSLGAAARYGAGDVQWLTAGQGVVHAEMFPLLNASKPNPLQLFQIWLNLPAKRKMVAPHFKMFWSEDKVLRTLTDAQGRSTEVALIAGRYADAVAPTPPPDSWAAQADADVVILTIRMAPGAVWTLPAAGGTDTQRCLYFFKGSSVTLSAQVVTQHAAIELSGDAVELVNGEAEGEFLLLQGKPIGEPVEQYGPFVMNTRQEIEQTLRELRNGTFIQP